MQANRRTKASRYNFRFRADDGRDVAYNAATGAMLRLDGAESALFSRFLDGDADAEDTAGDPEAARVREAMVRGGFLVDDAVDEVARLTFRSLARRYSSEFFYLTIMPTLACNMACPYCYETPRPGVMSDETADRLVAWAERRARTCRQVAVGWFGGEPLLAFRTVERISRGLSETCRRHGAGFSASMTTNAYGLTPRIARRLPDLGIRTLQVTLDGPREEHDRRRCLKAGRRRETYDRIVGNVAHVLEAVAGVRVILRVNYDERSYATLPRLLHELPPVIRDGCEIYFRQVYPPPQWWDRDRPAKETSVPRGRDHVDDEPLLRLAIDLGYSLKLTSFAPQAGYCEADYLGNFVVDPDGNLHKCTVAFDEDHRVGRLEAGGEVTLDEALLSRWMVRPRHESRRCRTCRMLPTCVGGCSFTALCAGGEEICNTIVDEARAARILNLLYLDARARAERRQHRARSSHDAAHADPPPETRGGDPCNS
jgi:uncharacterized protein